MYFFINAIAFPKLNMAQQLLSLVYSHIVSQNFLKNSTYLYTTAKRIPTITINNSLRASKKIVFLVRKLLELFDFNCVTVFLK